MRNEAEKSPGRVESVHRALVLLARILDEESLSVTEAAALLDVNASTAQRLLATLAGDGFAQQRPDRRYALGPAMAHPRLTHAAPDLRARLRGPLEALFDRTGETVHVSMLLGTQIEQIDAIEAMTHQLRTSAYLGMHLPADLTAAGRAMLATLPRDEVDARYRLAHQDTDLDALHATLDTVRRAGVATNLEESEPGLAAVSVCVGTHAGSLAALSIAVPAARYTPALGALFQGALQDIAAEIARGRA